ncbi:hypothetical protein O6H91_22G051000 [Diphasiastrum complanatum]|uniref:Uncharacterized protein n=1 Tax=Diphasiastrum complanatum TaxID=34168 RepID=A0ACC2AGR7_DIPCM|nr:hypothetical protein O6H91_22G051000 [Diphasiastrum complanatum]
MSHKTPMKIGCNRIFERFGCKGIQKKCPIVLRHGCPKGVSRLPWIFVAHGMDHMTSTPIKIDCNRISERIGHWGIQKKCPILLRHGCPKKISPFSWIFVTHGMDHMAFKFVKN